MKKIVGISLVLLGIRLSAIATLDDSFGTGGRVSINFGGTNDQVNGVVQQPDGRIVTVGFSNAAGNNDFALVRYNADGSLDSSFGSAGLVTTDFGANDQADALLIQLDGKIVAVGSSNVSGNFEFALARYNPDGSLDSSFGSGGLVTTNFGSTNDQARAVLLQPDGKIVAAGRANIAGSNDFALARYNPDGSLDSSFGTGGLVTSDFGVATDDRATSALLLQPDGKIVAAGRSNAAGDTDFALARYNSDGSLDSSFGIGGLVTTHFGGTDDRILAVALQPDGKIVAVGRSDATGDNDFALARYTTDGSLDSSFGIGGLVTTHFGGDDEAFAVVLQSNGKIVVVGRVISLGFFKFGVARYQSDGSLDTSFAPNGLILTSFGVGSNDQGLSAVLQANGRIVVAGRSNASGLFDFALARYLIPSITISLLARDLRAKYFLLQ